MMWPNACGAQWTKVHVMIEDHDLRVLKITFIEAHYLNNNTNTLQNNSYQW